MAHSPRMLLTESELGSLIHATHRCPHQLLGMHPLGDGSGVVARALLPNAAKVEFVPTHENDKPRITLNRIHDPGLFEGVAKRPSRFTPTISSSPITTARRARPATPYSFLPTLGEMDLYLFGEGNERRIYDKLGAQLKVIDGVSGTSFAVWAPNAQRVSVVGAFNNWDGRVHAMRSLGASGVWEIFVPGVFEGALYKYEIRDAHGHVVLKTDPYGFFSSPRPRTPRSSGTIASSSGPTTNGCSTAPSTIRFVRR